MRILVTGGAGFIGSNVVDGYVRAGHEVVVVDDLSSGSRSNVNKKARFFEMDIRSPEIGGLLKQERPEIVNHHAAQISVPESVSNPSHDADVNIKGLLNLLEAAKASGTEKIIFISSGGAIYGDAPEYPTSEQCQPRPLSPYAVSKFCSEYYLAYYRHYYGLNFTTLRYANVYGPRQIPHGEAGVVAIFMNNLLDGKESHLNHFPDDDLGMIRDYCFVGDVVKANILALEHGSGEYFNIGTGVGTKTMDLYRVIFRACDRALPAIASSLAEPARRPARGGDIQRSCLVVNKAASLLGWEPETALDEGIHTTLQWRLVRRD